MREEYFEYVSDYKDKLELLMKELEFFGYWIKLERRIVLKYFFENNGVVFIFKKC